MSATWDESERIAALRRYDVLDTDIAFDDVVQIAAQICRAPIAVVNFIDENRQWFASELGLGVRETPVDVSICAHAILQPDIFVIPDLTQDSRFDGNPLVAGDPKLRFYGGALLSTPSGLPLGTVCVLDYTPRPDGLSEDEKSTLRSLARQVMTELELRRSVREKDLLVAEAHHRVANSLQMVQGLLSLQARQTRDSEAAQQLRDSAARVSTFGLMHEHLYRSGAAMEVDLAGYLRRLVEDQHGSLASTLRGRGVRFRGESVMWPSKDAASLGLVCFELVTNALKYGEGLVCVDVTEAGGDLFIRVEDEGTGLPADHDPSQSSGLGMSLVRGLLQSRGGELSIDRGRAGTCFVARLEIPRETG